MYVLLPAMFGPVMSRLAAGGQLCSAPFRRGFVGRSALRVVGNKRAIGRRDIEHRMATVDDSQHRLFDAPRAGNSRVAGPAPPRPPARRVATEPRPSLAIVRRRRRRHVAQFDEQFVFKLFGPFVGRENFFFVFLQLGRDIALGVLDGLLAMIIVGNLVAMRMRDFQIIAEHFVESDFQARDAGAGNFVGLILCHPLLAAGREIAERVELA